jgi:hypothetical protein
LTFRNGVYRVMITDDEHTGKGEALQSSLESYRQLLLSNASPALQSTIAKLLDIGPWRMNHGWDIISTWSPMIGAINVLSNLQLNIRFLEGEVLREIRNEETAASL